MIDTLRNLGQPSEFWKYFEAITKIPRCSGKEAEIRAFIKNEAEKFGYKTKIDSVGNLMVRIPPKGAKVIPNKVVLQCHMDMVCEKNANKVHDFSKDPIKLNKIEISGEKWLKAQGTTLGADNGVGIAYLLTLMKKFHKDELNFGPIEMLFTIDEESGLVGAFNIQPGFVDGNYLINIDSEEDDTFTIGCAGGINTTGQIPINFEILPKNYEIFIPLKISITGLIGGHSGVDIHLGRANAIKILSKILWKLNNSYELYLNHIEGGNRANAIPREASAIFFIEKEQKERVFNLISQIKKELELGISKIEPSMNIIFGVLHDFNENKIFPKIIQDKLFHILYIMPNGPISWHPNTKDLVYTSTNLASIIIKTDCIEILTSQRSFHEISKRIILEQVEALFRLADINIDIQHKGDYPSWEPNFNSELLKICKEIYIGKFNQEPHVQAIHAGLECGILKKVFPEMEMISIGPTIEGPHSPDEKLKIDSIEKMWKFLIALLQKICV